jgi:hypothetical protein
VRTSTRRQFVGVRVRPEIWRAIKTIAAERGETVRQTVEEILSRGLAHIISKGKP